MIHIFVTDGVNFSAGSQTQPMNHRADASEGVSDPGAGNAGMEGCVNITVRLY